MNTTDVQKLARSLMGQHGLAPEWGFRWWDKNFCFYEKKIITLDQRRAQQSDASEIRFILLHEIAHALVGSGHGHDEVWRAKDLSIGGRGERYLVDDDARQPLTDAEIAALIDDADTS